MWQWGGESRRSQGPYLSVFWLIYQQVWKAQWNGTPVAVKLLMGLAEVRISPRPMEDWTVAASYSPISTTTTYSPIDPRAWVVSKL